jgi:hypothetical protein
MVASNQIEEIRQLLEAYSFGFEGRNINLLITRWLQQFDPLWIHHAIVEALYQGRYKTVSVDHILTMWQRRGSPLRHYTREFESIILGPNSLPEPAASPPARKAPEDEPIESTTEDPSESGSGEKIKPFVPQQSESELYHRLQAVARCTIPAYGSTLAENRN